jgi:hypothetical protein
MTGRRWTLRLGALLAGAAIVVLGLGSPALANQYGQQFAAVHSGRCLDLTGANPTNGTPIQQFTCLGNRNQGWNDGDNTNDGYFVFQNAATGKCIDGFYDYEGGDVVEWTCDHSQSQRWLVMRPDLDHHYDWMQFKNVANGFCLDVRGKSQNDGARIQLYHCIKGGTNQYWH